MNSCNSNHDCCEGLEILTPMLVANQPGLNALAYRVGTHANFLETMKVRLGSSDFSALKNLTIRDTNDPSIALLDAWATVADVLTFYQERIANEGYLRTAGERRSLLELAHLVDYASSPGVSASVYLAFTLEDGYDIEIPAGICAQSLPTSDELPQSFETSATLKACAELNYLKLRMSQPQQITFKKTNTDANLDTTDARQIDEVYLEGIGNNLKPNDSLLFIFGNGENQQIFRRVQTIEPQPAENRTKVILQTIVFSPKGSTSSNSLTAAQKIKQVLKSPSPQPANILELERTKQQIFNPKNFDIESQLIKTLKPDLKNAVHQILTSNNIMSSQLQCIKALGIKSAPFGHDIPLKPVFNAQGQIDKYEEWQIAGVSENNQLSLEQRQILVLEAQYDEIVPGSWIAIARVNQNEPGIYRVEKVEDISKTDYDTVGRVTQLTLDKPWLQENDTSVEVLRKTTVYIPSETLTLTEKPIDFKEAPRKADKPIPTEEDSIRDRMEIELDDLYEGLHPGRWLIISGERSDIPDISGVMASEVVMLAGVKQDVRPDLPDEKPHTFLWFARPLAYSYKRDTVTIYGNVVKATHGETRTEILGSGDGTQAFQQFTLSQPPLTYLPAPTPTGVVSTLEVYVNDIRWREVESLAQLSPTDRCFVTYTNNDGNTTIIFGNGVNGARLPTGVENIKAVYRTGIGKGGNVTAGQINQLAMQPLGLSAVLNPLPATGGADPESLDEVRRNAPLGMICLDRAVSVQDYADFALTFTGIGKASAVRLSNGTRQIVHLTIAGAEDIPIDRNSDLYRNFRQALYQFSDPYLPIQIDIRELMLLIIAARVRILPDYRWISVEPKIRAALWDTFSFQRRELGQDVVLSEVISTIQQVSGVDYVDIDILDSVSEYEAKHPEILAQKLEQLAGLGTRLGEKQSLQPQQRIQVNLANVPLRVADTPDGTLRERNKHIYPAQLAILSPEVADTLILKELKS